MENHSVQTPTMEGGLSDAMASDSDTEFETMNTSFRELDRWQANIGLKTFGEGLSAAAKAIFPDNSRSRYTNVYVLMLCWADEDPTEPLAIEILNLFRVFKDIYNFNIEVCRIPARNSDVEVQEQIRDLIKQGGDSDDDLKIVFYAGESRLTKSKELLWTRCVSCLPVEQLLMYEADVLIHKAKPLPSHGDGSRQNWKTHTAMCWYC